MHQDQRIGLALGVLLIGACAAFFFRNETRERSEIPQLHNAQKLDDRIAERTTRPYLNGIEVVEAGNRSRMRTVADRGLSSDNSDEDHGTAYWSPVESFGGKQLNEKAHGQRKPRANHTDLEGDVQELEPISVPGDNVDTQGKTQKEPIEGGSRFGRIGLKSTENSSDGLTHVVQKGDTLSSIATKRLGNANRFHEIFDANHDQLKDANDLRAGMILRIPDARAELPSKTPASKGRSGGDIETSIRRESTSLRDVQKESEPTSVERRSPAPAIAIEELPSVQVLNDGSNEPQNDSPLESLQRDATSPAKKFVPSRRFTPPARTFGAQVKAIQSASEKAAQ